MPPARRSSCARPLWARPDEDKKTISLTRAVLLALVIEAVVLGVVLSVDYQKLMKENLPPMLVEMIQPLLPEELHNF